MSLRTSREQPHDRPVNGHSLIRLILNRKGVSHADPSIEEAAVQLYCFLEVLPSYLELLAVEVVSTYCEPTHRMR